MISLEQLEKHIEEWWNAATHGLGFVAAGVGSSFLLYWGLQKGLTMGQLLALGLFGASLMLLFLASTLYHGVRESGWKYRLRRMDHIAIYFLIAGTHTPFIYRYLPDTSGLWYLGALWSLVVLGTLYKIFFMGRWERFSLSLYLFMGWMVVFILPWIWAKVDATTWMWIGLGGLSYTVGVIFYRWERLPYNHAIWHLFVLGGGAGHYIALLNAYGLLEH